MQVPAGPDDFLRARLRRLTGELRPRAKEFRRGANAFRKSPIAMVGLIIIMGFVLMATFAPLLAAPVPGARDPLQMATDFSQGWCPSLPAYSEPWTWRVDAEDPAARTFEFTINLPPVPTQVRDRDAEFDVVAYNDTEAIQPTDYYLDGVYQTSAVSNPKDPQPFMPVFAAPGTYEVRARVEAVNATVTWHVVVPSATQSYPLLLVPNTNVVLRPTGYETHFEVHTARDCLGLFFHPSSAITLPWTVDGEPRGSARSFDFVNRSAQGSLIGATFSRAYYPFGQTDLGMDIYYGVVWGSQVSMRIGLEVVALSIVIGVLLGLLAGYHGGWIDESLMRITDVFFGIPSLILAMTVIVSIGPTLDNLVLALVIVSWPGYARLIRGVTLTVKTNLYVEASRASGTRTGAILWRHIFPNTISPIMVQATLDIGGVVLTAAGLAFIGFSFATETTAEWGTMINVGQQEFGASSFKIWWPVFYPGLFIFLFVLGFNMLGDGLRDVLDPRLRR